MSLFFNFAKEKTLCTRKYTLYNFLGLAFSNDADLFHLLELALFYCWLAVHFQRRQWQPTPMFLPGKPHGQRSLVGYSLKGHKVSDTAEWLSIQTEAGDLGLELSTKCCPLQGAWCFSLFLHKLTCGPPTPFLGPCGHLSLQSRSGLLQTPNSLWLVGCFYFLPCKYIPETRCHNKTGYLLEVGKREPC